MKKRSIAQRISPALLVIGLLMELIAACTEPRNDNTRAPPQAVARCS